MALVQQSLAFEEEEEEEAEQRRLLAPDEAYRIDSMLAYLPLDEFVRIARKEESSVFLATDKIAKSFGAAHLGFAQLERNELELAELWKQISAALNQGLTEMRDKSRGLTAMAEKAFVARSIEKFAEFSQDLLTKVISKGYPVDSQRLQDFANLIVTRVSQYFKSDVRYTIGREDPSKTVVASPWKKKKAESGERLVKESFLIDELDRASANNERVFGLFAMASALYMAAIGHAEPRLFAKLKKWLVGQLGGTTLRADEPFVLIVIHMASEETIATLDPDLASFVKALSSMLIDDQLSAVTRFFYSGKIAEQSYYHVLRSRGLAITRSISELTVIARPLTAILDLFEDVTRVLTYSTLRAWDAMEELGT